MTLYSFSKQSNVIVLICLRDQTWLCVYCWCQTPEGVVLPRRAITRAQPEWSPRGETTPCCSLWITGNSIRWRPSQKRRAAGHNRQHVISRRLQVLPTCPEWLRLSPGLPSPAEAGLWQLTQGSRYGSHHARSLETSWWIGNKNCQILRRTHSKLCYM